MISGGDRRDRGSKNDEGEGNLGFIDPGLAASSHGVRRWRRLLRWGDGEGSCDGFGKAGEEESSKVWGGEAGR